MKSHLHFIRDDIKGGRVPKWLKGVDRKSAIRWFKSSLGLYLMLDAPDADQPRALHR